jgi:nucleoside phosphorylase
MTIGHPATGHPSSTSTSTGTRTSTRTNRETWYNPGMPNPPDDSLVRPPRLRKLPAGVRRALLFPIDPFGRKELDSVPRDLIQSQFSSLFTRYVVLPGRVAVCPALSAPAAAMAVDSLAVSGVERILAVGSCGTLDPVVRCGDVVIVRDAFSACGTTAHYAPGVERFGSDPGLSGKVVGHLVVQGIPLRPVSAVTTDAPYRETPDFIENWSARGAQVVEMECAAVFAAARRRGVAAGAVLVVSDRPGAGKAERVAGLARYALAMRSLLPHLWTLDF